MRAVGTEVGVAGGTAKSASCREFGISWSREIDGTIYTGGSTDLYLEGYDPKPSRPPAMPFSGDRRDTAHAFE